MFEDLEQLLEKTVKELDDARVKLDKRDEKIKELEKKLQSQKGQYSLHKKPRLGSFV